MGLEDKAALVIKRELPELPHLAVVLGSGFGSILQEVKPEVSIPFRKLPGFAQPRVPGHQPMLHFCRIGKTALIILAGRLHFYEGWNFEQIGFPIRVLASTGVTDLLLTNAAGGINPKFKPGDFMAITDHLNFMGANPLRGERASGGDHFIDLSEAYDRPLQKVMARAARKCRIALKRGVYLAVSGPSYETPAEIRCFSKWGADAVGMSTVPEAIVARQQGIRVAGLSFISNAAAGSTGSPLSHQEVLEMGRRHQKAAACLLRNFVVEWSRG